MPSLESSGPALAFLEDDLDFSAMVIRDLEQTGCIVSHFQSGNDCLKSMRDKHYDICVFDIQLPDLSGLEVMARLKAIDRMPPVIFMTSHDTEEDVAHVLLAGADDYIIKPPSISILQARIKALLRRTRISTKSPEREQLGHLLIDYSGNQIFSKELPVALTGKETLLAFALFRQRGQIIPRQELYQILGMDDLAVDTRRLDVHISRLRSKLELNITHGWKLSSIYQRGYRLEYFNGE